MPENYKEVDPLVGLDYTSIAYQHEEGMLLYFDFSYMHQGTAMDILTKDMVVFEITVKGCTGQIFLSEDPNQSNAITWTDEKLNIQVTVNGFVDKSELLHMAESITLCDS